MSTCSASALRASRRQAYHQVNTTAGLAKFVVAGTSSVLDSGNVGHQVITVAQANLGVIRGYSNQTGGMALSFETTPSGGSATERMRIDTSGNLLVGATSGLSGAKTEIRQNADANYSTTFTTGTTKNLLTLRDLSDVGTYSTPFSTLAFAAGSSGSAWATITGVRTASQSSAIAFGTANGSSNTEERMRIDSSGNVGIGVTPSAKLDVNGLGWFRADASANGVDILGRSSDNAGQLRILTNNAASTLATLVSYGNDVALLNNTASYSLLLGTNGTERMRIDSSGNVGIGTSSPGAKLDVVSGSFVDANARISTGASTTGNYARLTFAEGAGATTLGWINSWGTAMGAGLDSGMEVWNNQNSFLRFGTNNTERMRITSAGNVGIGTASPSSKLHVAGALTLDTALSAANGGTGLTSPGTSGNVLTSNGSAWVSSAPSGSANLQEFTSSGTWTKPSGATFVMVECWGAGGGGASGSARGTAGANRSGGGGGGGGAYSYRVFKASDLGATESITIGAGGAGGAAQVSGGGAIGNDGGNTSFGTKLLAYGGGGALLSSGGGGGGVLSAAVSITAGEPFTSATTAGDFGGGSYTAPPSGFGAGAGGNGNTSGTASSAGGCSYQGGAGGGAGSGLNTSNNPTNAAAGGYNAGRTGGGGATNFFAAGSAGSALGMGGGGGWGNTGANAFAGGNGGIAAGGGGGGAGHNGNSGAGGNGGNGFCRVYSW